MRTLESMETAGALIPSDVLDEHRLKPLPHQRLMAIDKELQAAAASGDTSMVRRLKAEKKSIEAAQQRESAQMLAELRARAKAQEIAAPVRGEEKALDKRAQQLGRELAAKQGQLEKVLGRLTRNPESEVLLDKIDLLKSQLPELAAELQVIAARQEEIAHWRDEEARKKDVASQQAEWERNAPAHRKRLAIVVSEVLDGWTSIDAGLAEIEQLLDALENPNTPESNLGCAIYERLREATDGAIAYDARGWQVSWVRRRK